MACVKISSDSSNKQIRHNCEAKESNDKNKMTWEFGFSLN